MKILKDINLYKNQAMDPNEEWTNVKGYDYFVSTYGNVENARTGQILKPGIEGSGYYFVFLYKEGMRKKITVHRLVADAFIENLENKRCVDHVNNDKLDNRVDNLRWATDSENTSNSVIRSDNTSGSKGVWYHKGGRKWCAEIMINGKKKYIGLFKTKEEASQARKEYANELFGEFTNDCEKE